MNRWYLRYFLKSSLMFNDEIRIGDIRLYKDGNSNFASMEVNENSKDTAIKRGEELLIAVFGSINIIMRQQISFTLIDVQQINSLNGFCFGSSDLECEIKIVSSFPIDKTAEISDIFEISLNDNKLYRVLALFNHYEWNNWVNLYRIYEVINSEVNVVKIGWVDKKFVDNFKHTANSPQVLGKDSRHGDSRMQPPKVPMDIKYAESLIKSILVKWIQYKKSK